MENNAIRLSGFFAISEGCDCKSCDEGTVSAFEAEAIDRLDDMQAQATFACVGARSLRYLVANFGDVIFDYIPDQWSAFDQLVELERGIRSVAADIDALIESMEN